MSESRPYAHVLASHKQEETGALSLVVVLAVVAVVVAVAAAILLALAGGESWAMRQPIAAGLSIGIGLYHLGLLTIIAVNSER